MAFLKSKRRPPNPHHTSIDILYDLLEKLDPKQRSRAILNHVKRMRREGKIPKVVDLVLDSVIISLSVRSLKKSRFEKIAGRKVQLSMDNCIGINTIVASKSMWRLTWRARLFCISNSVLSQPTILRNWYRLSKWCASLNFSVAVQYSTEASGKQTTSNGLWRRGILFYTVPKYYTDDFRALVASINSRSEGRRRVRDGFWVT